MQDILIVDDEKDLLLLLKRTLTPELNCRVATALSGEKALEALSQKGFDLVLIDIKMPDMDGFALLKRIKALYPLQTVVMMTAYGAIDKAVEAIKEGAYDFITKPFEHDALIVRLEKALERSHLLRENVRLQKECTQSDIFHNLVGNSKEMKRVYETIQTVAKTDLTVLIRGESGVGKDLTARAIHAMSDRSNGPYVVVNCPTVPENILESELFGYKKGAFTHAVQNKIGLFQEAHNGTICLDEIGDIPPAIQIKLLRVLQEKKIKPLGDTKTVSVNVRIIASTNRNLEEKIKKKEFREDFFYRLNVLPVNLPPLRHHKEDIPIIANYLLDKHLKKMKIEKKKFSPEIMDIFMNKEWTGNVRELENIIVQGIIYSKKGEINKEDIHIPASDSSPPPPILDAKILPYKTAKEKMLQAFNNTFIGGLLQTHKGNITRAARTCGLERQSLQQIMRRYGITAEKYRE